MADKTAHVIFSDGPRPAAPEGTEWTSVDRLPERGNRSMINLYDGTVSAEKCGLTTGHFYEDRGGNLFQLVPKAVPAEDEDEG